MHNPKVPQIPWIRDLWHFLIDSTIKLRILLLCRTFAHQFQNIQTQSSQSCSQCSGFESCCYDELDFIVHCFDSCITNAITYSV
jgi:hypothetical protein